MLPTSSQCLNTVKRVNMQTNSASRAYICIMAFDCHAEATKMHKQMVYERQSINSIPDSFNYLGLSQNMI